MATEVKHLMKLKKILIGGDRAEVLCGEELVYTPVTEYDGKPYVILGHGLSYPVCSECRKVWGNEYKDIAPIFVNSHTE